MKANATVSNQIMASNSPAIEIHAEMNSAGKLGCREDAKYAEVAVETDDAEVEKKKIPKMRQIEEK